MIDIPTGLESFDYFESPLFRKFRIDYFSFGTNDSFKHTDNTADPRNRSER